MKHVSRSIFVLAVLAALVMGGQTPDVSQAARDVLEKLASLPLSYWNYKAGDEAAATHLGPTAEDFQAVFALGNSAAAISTLDAEGVSLAAIKGLYEIMKERDAVIAIQTQKLADQEKRLASLEARLALLEQTIMASRE